MGRRGRDDDDERVSPGLENDGARRNADAEPMDAAATATPATGKKQKKQQDGPNALQQRSTLEVFVDSTVRRSPERSYGAQSMLHCRA